MVVIGAGAVLAGLLASLVMPLPPFACALLVAIAIGSTASLGRGVGLAQTTWSAASLLVLSQFGYAAGLAMKGGLAHMLQIVKRSSHRGSELPDAHLRPGNEPH